MFKSLRTVLFVALVPFTLVACGDRAPTPAATTPLPMIPSTSETTTIAPPTTVLDPVTPAKVDPITLEAAQPIPTKFGEVMTLGKELAAKGDHARAREMFEAAILLDKKKASPHVELARLFVTTGERALAMTAATKAVKLAPESSQAWNTLGRAELARHGYDDAVVAFRQATELDPDNVWAWNNLGLVHLSNKRYQEAADALVEATRRKTAESYMFNNLGTAYEQLDQLDDARVAFARGADLGSGPAAASRKRLEGVKTIVVVVKKPMVEKPMPLDTTYDVNDEVPALVDEVKPDMASPVEPAPEPKPEGTDGVPSTL